MYLVERSSRDRVRFEKKKPQYFCMISRANQVSATICGLDVYARYVLLEV